MNAFAEFRLWWRRGPSAEKRLTAVSGAVIVALLAWALVPFGETRSQVATGVSPGGGIPGGTAVKGVQQTTTTSLASGTTAQSGAAASTTSLSAGSTTNASVASGPTVATVNSRTGAPCPSGPYDQGVTATQINVAVTVFDVAGANSSIGQMSAQQQEAMWTALWNNVNASGGLQCHKVVPTYYSMNPLDQNGQHSACLSIVQAKPFALVGDAGFFPQSQRDCVAQNKIPVFGSYGPLLSEIQQYSPYIFTFQTTADQMMHNWAYGAQQAGFFSAANGFTKLGVFDVNCATEVNSELETYLNQLKIPHDTFVADCPTGGQTPPNECLQAAVDQVSDSSIFLNGGGDPNRCYVSAAKNQGQSHHYSTSEYILGVGAPNLGTSYDSTAFDGALGIEAARFGELAAGIYSPGTQVCNKILQQAGIPPLSPAGDVDANDTDEVPGFACDEVTMFTAAVDHAASLTRTALVGGLDRAGTVTFSYPASDATFSNGAVTGSDYWRAVPWLGSCGCWKVQNQTWYPNFK